MSQGLAWPPAKEDLERLYLVEKLSAAKIARVYGLKYKNEKSAESTVLYQLKKNGIQRRESTEHIRKVSEGMVDDWVRRYRAGESLKVIAEGKVSPVSVFLHLRKRGVKLRDRVEAQIIAVRTHNQLPFLGGELDKAYLLGFTRGDLYVVRHGRAVRVKTSTTHPLMTELFRSLFGPYGYVREFPRKSRLTDYEWSLECDLDTSFGFLLEGIKGWEWGAANSRRFMAYLAGFFDAEGSIYFHRKKKWGTFEVSIANRDRDLLQAIADSLIKEGYVPTMTINRQSSDRGVGREGDVIWRLTMWRYSDVRKLIADLALRHPEKKRKTAIALDLGFRATASERVDVISRWEALSQEIKLGNKMYIEKARKMLYSAKSAQNELSGPLRPANNSFPRR